MFARFKTTLWSGFWGDRAIIKDMWYLISSAVSQQIERGGGRGHITQQHMHIETMQYGLEALDLSLLNKTSWWYKVVYLKETGSCFSHAQKVHVKAEMLWNMIKKITQLKGIYMYQSTHSRFQSTFLFAETVKLALIRFYLIMSLLALKSIDQIMARTVQRLKLLEETSSDYPTTDLLRDLWQVISSYIA